MLSLPVPGTLKKRPFEALDVARQLLAQFGLPEMEGLAYLKLVETGGMKHEDIAGSLGLAAEEVSTLVKSMIARGLAIESSRDRSTLVPLHPRMMLTNLFKIYENEVVSSLRERRTTVDRLVVLLIPVYEETESRKKG
jgi:sugar-specific transcriptional regulator TrmB